MANFQNFRSAFNGFNREDVVHYIEFINNEHASELNQLNTEMSALYTDLEGYRNAYNEASKTAAQLQQEKDQAAAAENETITAQAQQILALQQEIKSLKLQLEQVHNQPKTGSELEAYRRAERA